MDQFQHYYPDRSLQSNLGSHLFAIPSELSSQWFQAAWLPSPNQASGEYPFISADQAGAKVESNPDFRQLLTHRFDDSPDGSLLMRQEQVDGCERLRGAARRIAGVSSPSHQAAFWKTKKHSTGGHVAGCPV